MKVFVGNKVDMRDETNDKHVKENIVNFLN